MEPYTRNGSIIGQTMDFGEDDRYILPSDLPRGEAEYTTPGTYSWTAPTGVTSVSVVCVGAGGGPAANTNGSCGAGGGGLGWKNNIAVTPGNSYTVVVGAGGTRVTSGTAPAGGNSYFINTSTVAGFGGGGAIAGTASVFGAGGGFVGDGGGNGGNGGARGSTAAAGGGGGAGGYSGNGGNGATGYTVIGSPNGQNGSGGGAGGGGGCGSVDTAGAGGGVGIYGEGDSGAGGATGSIDGAGGFGGSGGENASQASLTILSNVYGTGNQSRPGLYGGGGSGSDNPTVAEQANGAGGAVRIIWGTGRAFPDSFTADNEDGFIFGNKKNSGVWDLSASYLYEYGLYISSLNLSFVGEATSAANSGTITLPSGLEEDDVVFIATFADSDAVNLPTGYTNGQNGELNSVSYRWSYKKMGATPDSTASGLTNKNDTVHIAFALRGVSVDVFDTTTPTVTSGGSGMPNPPSITTTTNFAKAIKIGYLDDDIVTNVGAPSGFTMIISATAGTSGSGGTIMAAYRTLETPGSTGTGAFTGAGSDDWVGATFAIRAKLND